MPAFLPSALRQEVIREAEEPKPKTSGLLEVLVGGWESYEYEGLREN